MLTTFVDVKKEVYTFGPSLLNAAKKVSVLRHAVLMANDEKSYNYYISAYSNFNDLIKSVIGLKMNNLVVWRIFNDSLQILVLDYLDDGNIYQVLHFPTEDELEEMGTKSIVGLPLEITTFENYAEEVETKDLGELTELFMLSTKKPNDKENGEHQHG